MKVDIYKLICKELIGFVSVLDSWIFEKSDNIMTDCFEMDYCENYSPANAAVIYASVYNIKKNNKMLDKCKKMIRRSLELINSRYTKSFCKVFLVHYCLISIILLKTEKKTSLIKEFEISYSKHIDKCKIINTNCAALKYGIELMLDILSVKKLDINYTDYLCNFILNAQNEFGFINDSINDEGNIEDGMPIAYHAFILFILVSILSIIDKNKIPQKQYDVIKSILEKGLEWIGNTVTLDGSYAMAERSSYQVFTWGIFLPLCLYGGINKKSPFLLKAFEYWQQYKKDDGSYSCTPNHVPHELRVGFESYTHVNMYNNLAMTGLAIAESIMMKKTDLGNDKLSNIFINDNKFMDINSGYGFYRKEGNFFGFTTRSHKDMYIPALSGFHYRLNNKKIPIAEARILYKGLGPDNIYNHTWEGFLLEDPQNERILAKSNDNAKIRFIMNGVELVYEDNNVRCIKKILVENDRLIWKYKIIPKRNFIACEHVIPIIVHDGKFGNRFFQVSSNVINMYYCGCEYQLSCNPSKKIHMQINRSFTSTSGITTNLIIRINNHILANKTVEWTTCFRVCKAVQENQSLQMRLSENDSCPLILAIEPNKISPQLISTPIRYKVVAEGENLTYAWYVYKNGKKIATHWYSVNNYLDLKPTEEGIYKIRAFVKDSIGFKTSKISKEFHIKRRQA